MKKIFLVCIGVILLLCGCSDEFSGFEHYDLSGKDLNVYNYYDDVRGKETYVLADMTPENYESCLTGLYYKISDNDYILLERLESSTFDAYKKDFIYQFYDGKLYGIGRGSNLPLMFTIELKGKDSVLDGISFKVGDKGIGPTSIENIENNTIKVYGYIRLDDEPVASRHFDCSLETYQCEIIKVD